MSQDTINVFQNPVDSVRVAVEDVTSNQITQMMDFTESLVALWNLVEPVYIILVCVIYYVIVTRVQFIKTNTVGRRNALMLIVTIVAGVVAHFWHSVPSFDLLVSGLFVNFCYEHLFKRGFKVLERFGFTPLPQWHIEEIRKEKENDIKRAEQQNPIQ